MPVLLKGRIRGSLRWSRQGFCRPCKEFGFYCRYNEKVFEGLKHGITSVSCFQNIIPTLYDNGLEGVKSRIFHSSSDTKKIGLE